MLRRPPRGGRTRPVWACVARGSHRPTAGPQRASTGPSDGWLWATHSSCGWWVAHSHPPVAGGDGRLAQEDLRKPQGTGGRASVGRLGARNSTMGSRGSARRDGVGCWCAPAAPPKAILELLSARGSRGRGGRGRSICSIAWLESEAAKRARRAVPPSISGRGMLLT